jgi:hypothetical protein
MVPPSNICKSNTHEKLLSKSPQILILVRSASKTMHFLFPLESMNNTKLICENQQIERLRTGAGSLHTLCKFYIRVSTCWKHICGVIIYKKRPFDLKFGRKVILHPCFRFVALHKGHTYTIEKLYRNFNCIHKRSLSFFILYFIT